MGVLEGKVGRTKGNVAVVVSRFNEMVTRNLLDGAIATLAEHGVQDPNVTVAWVPGAWEIPVIAQRFARSGDFSAVICLGAVIRGETTHDEYINHEVSRRLGALSLEFDLPVLFGLLTCQTLDQAINRSGGSVGNKGADCALAALEMMDLMNQVPA